MSGRVAPTRLPVRLDFAPEDGRAPSWGRLEALDAAGAKLSTLAALERGRVLFLTFEVGAERFEELEAVVAGADRDDDGFWTADVDFRGQAERRRLAKTLLDVLSR